MSLFVNMLTDSVVGVVVSAVITIVILHVRTIKTDFAKVFFYISAFSWSILILSLCFILWGSFGKASLLSIPVLNGSVIGLIIYLIFKKKNKE